MIEREVALDENMGPVGPGEQQVRALAHEVGDQQQRAVGNHQRSARFGLQDNHRAWGLRETHTVTQDKRMPWITCGHRFPSSVRHLPRNRRAKRRQRILNDCLANCKDRILPQGQPCGTTRGPGIQAPSNGDRRPSVRCLTGPFCARRRANLVKPPFYVPLPDSVSGTGGRQFDPG